jgi:hypothetical protein
LLYVVIKKSTVGLEPTTLRLEVSRAIQLRHADSLSGVGFEPTHPKILQLKCNPLDHSGIQTFSELLGLFLFKKNKILLSQFFAVSNSKNTIFYKLKFRIF